MSQRELLHQAILRQPNDDLLRLAYADWLEENEELDHANFIRLQIEKAPLLKESEERAAIHAREAEIRSRHPEGWPLFLPGLSGVGWQWYWRGFVAGAVIERWKHFEQNAEQIFSLTPIQFLTFNALSSTERLHLASSPFLSRLHGLSFRGWMGITDELARILARLPELVYLRSLSMPAEKARHFAPHEVWLSQLTDVGAIALIQSAFLVNLESLNLKGHRISKGIAAQLRKRFGKGVVQL